MHLPATPRRRALATALAVAVVLPGGALAATGQLASGQLAGTGKAAVHRSFRQSPAAYSTRYDTPVAPGVDLLGYSSAAAGRQANSNVLTVDLTHPGVRTGVLSGRVTDTAPVAGWAKQFGAVAAINGDYFDIGTSQAPVGPVVRSGILRKGLAAGQSLTGMGADGVLRTSTAYLDGTVTWGKNPSRPMDVYNSDLSGSVMPRNGLAVLDGGWGSSPLRFSNPPGKLAIAVVDGSHKVVKTMKKFARVTVPAHGLLLIGTGSYQGLAGLKKGSIVKDTVAVSTNAPAAFKWGLGSGLLLMRDGQVVHNYPNDTDPHDARTALGWSNGGHTMIVLTVEYGGGSVGEGVNEIADELAAQGATDAVLLDGGGSTTLVARQQGAPAPAQIGPVSNGPAQRRVPIGIGVFVPKGSGLLDGFNLGLDAGAVFPGLHRNVTYAGYDEQYGAATVNPARVTLATDSDGLLQADGTGRVQGLRPGAGHVTASTPTYAPGSPGVANTGTFLRVLQPLSALFTPGAVRLLPGATISQSLTGTDADGDTAPILASDARTTYDHSLLSVAQTPGGTLSVTARKVPEGAVTPLTVTVAGVSSTIVVHIGYASVPILRPAAKGALHVNGGTAHVVPVSTGVAGLSVAPTSGSATALVSRPTALPGGTARIGVTAAGDGLRHALGIVIVNAVGAQQRIPLGVISSRRQHRFEAAVPSGATLMAITIGRASGKHGGAASITQVVART